MDKRISSYIRKKTENFPIIYYNPKVFKHHSELTAKELELLEVEREKQLENLKSDTTYNSKDSGELGIVKSYPVNHSRRIRNILEKILKINKGLATLEQKKVAIDIIISIYYKQVIEPLVKPKELEKIDNVDLNNLSPETNQLLEKLISDTNE